MDIKVFTIKEIFSNSNKLIEFHKNLEDAGYNYGWNKYDWFDELCADLDGCYWEDFVEDFFKYLDKLISFGIVSYSKKSNGGISEKEDKIINGIYEHYDEIVEHFKNNKEYKREFDMGCGPL